MSHAAQFSFAANDDDRDNPKDQGTLELQKEQELLTLLGDPRVRVSVPVGEQRPESERDETIDQPPVSRRYQVT
jgi:hypothetical protein